MAIEVKQLVVKGTVLQESSEGAKRPDESKVQSVDERPLLAECRRIWTEEMRQRRER